MIAHQGRVPDWYGPPLPGVYLAWLVDVTLMYSPCRTMDRLKSTRPEWW